MRLRMAYNLLFLEFSITFEPLAIQTKEREIINKRGLLYHYLIEPTGNDTAKGEKYQESMLQLS